MGSNVTKTIDKWGLNPGKFSLQRTKRKGPTTAPPQQVPVYYPHVNDSVKAEPQYAQVNKRQKHDDHGDGHDGLHYADIQVLQSRSSTSRKKQPLNNQSTTEYATIDFNTPVNTHTPAKPADLFIPPGELKRPNMRSSRK